jgi:GGDEF domain-containing protein
MTRPGVAALCAATLTVPIMDLVWGRPVDKPFTTICSCLLFLLVTARLGTMVGMIQAQERQARHDALHDPLTGLANRVLFARHVQQYLDHHGDQLVSVLFLDLDGFKQVNDTLGHDIGDRLLVTVAHRLTAAVRDGDLVARLGGDEFAVLLQHTSQPDTAPSSLTWPEANHARGINQTHASGRPEAGARAEAIGRAEALSRTEAAAVADRIKAHLAHPVSLAGHTLSVSASIGISTQPCATIADHEALLRSADAAMDQAKTTSRGRHAVPTPHPPRRPPTHPVTSRPPDVPPPPPPSATSSQPPVRVSAADVPTQ